MFKNRVREHATVKEVPPPQPLIGGKSEGVIEKQRMVAAGGIQSKLKDFDFSKSGLANF